MDLCVLMENGAEVRPRHMFFFFFLEFYFLCAKAQRLHICLYNISAVVYVFFDGLRPRADSRDDELNGRNDKTFEIHHLLFFLIRKNT